MASSAPAPVLRKFLKANLPRPTLQALGTLRDRKGLRAIQDLLRNDQLGLSLAQRANIIRKILWIHCRVDCCHSHEEAVTVITDMLGIREHVNGVFVEAGCFKGGSSAKFSIASKLKNRRLILFDSFQGIPENKEQHDRNIFGGRASFKKGDYTGTVEEVRKNVRAYGVLDVCEFKEGWFEQTMPSFQDPVAAAYLDVDLASSTRTCLRYLYPLLQPGGFIYSQDGHLPLVLDVLRSEAFWHEEIGCSIPVMYGVGRSKLVKIIKT